MKKYSSEEVLQILIDQYNFQANFDSEVDKGQDLTFNTTIVEWTNICDLVEPAKLAAVYYNFFELKTSKLELIELLSTENNTLQNFCDYISKNADKSVIKPTLSLGSFCLEASIYKTLKKRLEEKGVDTKTFLPSKELAPFFDKYSSELVDVVSKIAPGVISYYKLRENLITKIGMWIFLLSICVLFISLLMHSVNWILILPLGISILLLLIGKRIKPTQYDIGGYHTIRDLIIGIKNRL